MGRQVHGGDIYRNQGVMDFSVNTNPLGPPAPVVEAVIKAAEKIVHYPDMECEELRRKIGEYEGLPKEQIICGNGAAELFYAVTAAVRPKRALLPVPAFSEYERALQTVGADIRYYELSDEQKFELDEGFLEEITEEIQMIFLCNPNNPTGSVISKELLEKILIKCQEKKVLLVLDECFIEFLEEPDRWECKGMIERFPRLLIVKALTKMFAMPGLRLGYGLSADESLLRKIRSVMQAWNVSLLAQAGGAAALTAAGDYCPFDYVEQTRQLVHKERKFLEKGLQDLGFSLYNSKANYVFFRGTPGLYKEALEEGILIRDCSNYRGLEEGYYRVAVRTRQENERLLIWLKRL